MPFQRNQIPEHDTIELFFFLSSSRGYRKSYSDVKPCVLIEWMQNDISNTHKHKQRDNEWKKYRNRNQNRERAGERANLSWKSNGFAIITSVSLLAHMVSSCLQWFWWWGYSIPFPNGKFPLKNWLGCLLTNSKQHQCRARTRAPSRTHVHNTLHKFHFVS